MWHGWAISINRKLGFRHDTITRCHHSLFNTRGRESSNAEEAMKILLYCFSLWPSKPFLSLIKLNTLVWTSQELDLSPILLWFPWPQTGPLCETLEVYTTPFFQSKISLPPPLYLPLLSNFLTYKAISLVGKLLQYSSFSNLISPPSLFIVTSQLLKSHSIQTASISYNC